jgi:hypothetical protein
VPADRVRLAHVAGIGAAMENRLPDGTAPGYVRRVGCYMVMVRRARLRAVAPGMGLAPAH